MHRPYRCCFPSAHSSSHKVCPHAARTLSGMFIQSNACLHAYTIFLRRHQRPGMSLPQTPSWLYTHTHIHIQPHTTRKSSTPLSTGHVSLTPSHLPTNNATHLPANRQHSGCVHTDTHSRCIGRPAELGLPRDGVWRRGEVSHGADAGLCLLPCDFRLACTTVTTFCSALCPFCVCPLLHLQHGMVW